MGLRISHVLARRSTGNFSSAAFKKILAIVSSDSRDEQKGQPMGFS